MSFLQQQIDKWRERFRDPRLWIPNPQTVHKDPNWQPIESAPKDGTEILLYPYAVCKWDTEDGAFFRDDSDIWPQHPTHWMPLPKPPKDTL